MNEATGDQSKSLEWL